MKAGRDPWRDDFNTEPAAQATTEQPPARPPTPIELLERRFAAGEIDREDLI